MNDADLSERVYVCEGEKDADRVASLKLVSTTCAQGASGWKEAYGYHETLRGRPVVILPDKDDAGRKHAECIASSLQGIAAEVRIVTLAVPAKGDISDWLDAGGTVADLMEIVDAAPVWTPDVKEAIGSLETIDDRATELANAEEVARRFGRDIHYNADSGRFVFFNGRCWEDDTGHVTRCTKIIAKTTRTRLGDLVDAKLMEKFTGRAESAAGIHGVIALLKTEPGITVTASQLDANDYLLPCENGMLDLTDAKLRPHRREDLFTRCLATPYHPDARAPTWQSFLDRVMDGNAEMVAYLQRIAGLCLTGAPNVHELFIAYGSGANGKSIFCDTILGLLDLFGGVAPDSLLITRNGQTEHPTELANLKGKRLIVASETESGAVLRLQLVKRLTGDSTITARFMRQDYFEFRRTHKMILQTNNRPRLTEDTEAVWRRLRIIPFNVVIPPAERDPNLIEKLKAEYPGILAWAVRGCLDYQRNGMQPPNEVIGATDDYRADSDDLADFIAERCITGSSTFRVSRPELLAAYMTWAKNERRPLERGAFYEAIRRREGVIEDRWKASGVAIRGFYGIALAISGDRGASE